MNTNACIVKYIQGSDREDCSADEEAPHQNVLQVIMSSYMAYRTKWRMPLCTGRLELLCDEYSKAY